MAVSATVTPTTTAIRSELTVSTAIRLLEDVFDNGLAAAGVSEEWEPGHREGDPSR